MSAEETRPLPVVAVVGRPNVGKSTLVNRIAGRQLAIVESRPGVTRDRLEVECEWNGRSFLVVDTGGVVERGDTLDAKVTEQALRALGDSDLVLLVLDVTTGVTGDDTVVGQLVRRNGGEVIVVANKVDSEKRELDAWELAGLGLGEPALVSALHGRGVGDLLDEVVKRLPAPLARTGESDEEATDPSERNRGRPSVPAVAIVGRPNVGKSTLFNRLSGEERSVVHDLPGTTRDAIDTLIETDDGTVKLDRYRRDAAPGAKRRRARVLLARAGAASARPGRRGLVGARRDRGRDPSGPASRRAHRRLREPGRDPAQQMGPARHREPSRGLRRRRRPPRLPRLRPGAAGLGQDGPRRAPPPACGARGHERLSPPHPHRSPQRRPAQRPVGPPGPGRGPYPLRRAGRRRPPDDHAVRHERLPPPYLRYLERSLRERFELGPTPIELRVRVRQQR